MPRAIATVRDAFCRSNADRRESAARFERSAFFFFFFFFLYIIISDADIRGQHE